MLDMFTDDRIRLPSGITLRVRAAGSGPPLLLLHGFPQTHLCWHQVAPRLVEAGFHVVLSDLRGYGGSDKPRGGPPHETYSKRAMAEDQVQLMRQLGHSRFGLVGHDRGGRVAHRLARDHAPVVTALSVLDIVPTVHVYATTDRALATAYYHWFLLIQPHPLPERLIGGDPEFFLRTALSGLSSGTGTVFSDEAVADYLAGFDSAGIYAACEDYRAGASLDLDHDARDAHRRLEMPVQVLWGAEGWVGKLYDVPAIWRDYAANVDAQALPCGHFLPEEAPDATADALIGFFRDRTG